MTRQGIHLIENGRISLKIYDILGKEVKTIVYNQKFSAQSHYFDWNGDTNNGARVSSGIYFAILSSKSFKKGTKMIYLP